MRTIRVCAPRLHTVQTRHDEPGMMRRIATLTAVVLLTLASAVLAQSEPVSTRTLPEQYTAQYSMHAYGAVVGSAKTSLSQSGESGRVYEQSTWPEGLAKLLVNQTIVERTSWTLHEGKPRPLHYEHVREGRKPRTTRLDFDWAEMRLSGERKNQHVSQDLSEGTHDKMTYILALMLDLAEARTDLSYTVTDGAKTRTYRFTEPKAMKLETALGTLSTLELKRVRDDDERETTFWFAPELRFVPVQIEHKEKGEHVIARIKSIEW